MLFLLLLLLFMDSQFITAALWVEAAAKYTSLSRVGLIVSLNDGPFLSLALGGFVDGLQKL